MTKSIPALLLMLFCLTAQAESPPSPEFIQQWWAKHSTEILDYSESPIEIWLRNKEIAYLLETDFTDRGRNFSQRSVLIRPHLQEIREIEHPVSRDNVVYDLIRMVYQK